LPNQEHLNWEALMDDKLKEGTTRRDLMKFAAASTVACVAGSLPLAKFDS